MAGINIHESMSLRLIFSSWEMDLKDLVNSISKIVCHLSISGTKMDTCLYSLNIFKLHPVFKKTISILLPSAS